MKKMLNYIIIASLTCYSLAQHTTIPFQPNTDLPQIEENITYFTAPIFRLEYKIREDQINDILSDLVMEPYYKLNSTDLNEVFNVNDTLLGGYSKDIDFEELFKFLNVSIIYVVNNIVRRIPNYKQVLPDILQILEIDKASYYEATSMDDQDQMYQLLDNANCSDEVLTEVFRLSNITLEDVVGIVKPLIFDALHRKNIEEFYKLYENYVKNWIKIISIDDIYKTPILSNIVLNFTYSLNNNNSWVIAVNENRFVTLLSASAKWNNLKEQAKGFLINFDNPNIRYEIKNIYPICTFSFIDVVDGNIEPYHHNFITLEKNYTDSPSMCLYLNDTIYGLTYVNVTNIEEKKTIYYVNIIDDLQYGTPLICDGNLYGLFDGIKNNRLSFVKLIDNEDDVNDDDDECDDIIDNGQEMMSFNIFIALALSAILLI